MLALPRGASRAPRGGWKSRWENGRVLEQLAVAVAVAVGRLDLAGRVERQPRLSAPSSQRAPGRSCRAGSRRSRAGRTAACRRSSRTRPSPRGRRGPRRPRRCGRSRRAPPPACRSPISTSPLNMSTRRPRHGSPAGGSAAHVGQPVHVRVGHPLLARERREAPDLAHVAGRLQVVEDRLVAREALVAHDLLDEQASPSSSRTCVWRLAGTSPIDT